jgi:hypothetical protein
VHVSSAADRRARLRLSATLLHRGETRAAFDDRGGDDVVSLSGTTSSL